MSRFSYTAQARRGTRSSELPSKPSHSPALCLTRSLIQHPGRAEKQEQRQSIHTCAHPSIPSSLHPLMLPFLLVVLLSLCSRFALTVSCHRLLSSHLSFFLFIFVPDLPFCSVLFLPFSSTIHFPSIWLPLPVRVSFPFFPLPLLSFLFLWPAFSPRR